MTTRRHDDLHDERFDAMWKHASSETPPAALDDAIRAAARREVGARPHDVDRVAQATRPERWWFPLAAAAMIGTVAIGVLQLATPDRVVPLDESRVVSDMPNGTNEPRAPASGAASQTAAPAEERKPESPRPVVPPSAAAEAPKPAPPRSRSAPAPASQARTEPAQDARAQRTPQPEAKREIALEKRATADDVTQQAQAPKIAEPQPFPLRVEPAEPHALAQRSTSDAAASRAVANAPTPSAPRAAAAPNAAPPAVASLPPPAATPKAGAPAAALPPPAGATPASAPLPDARRAAKLSSNRLDTVDALAKDRAHWTVDEWIAQLRKLRDERRDGELATELAAFRAVHANADALLPDDLREIRPAPR